MSEDLIVRHCSPTLAGLKTANLFAAEYTSEEALRNDLRALNRVLVPKGLRALPLRRENGRALIYLYRPKRLAQDLKDAQAAALLEPIGSLKVTIPDSYLGDVMGDLNKRRGRVMGMNPTGDGEQVLEAEVPMAEMMSYAIDLRSMTQSRGTFTFNFVRYEDCPAAAQEKAIAEAKALAEAE